MQLEIHTDIFTKKVLLRKLQNTNKQDKPIDVKNYLDLFGAFMLATEVNKSKITGCEVFTEPLSFFMPKQFQYLVIDKIRIAYKLKKIARLYFHEYMMAQHQAGQQILIGVQNFCDEYDIALDVDISFDSLIKGWQRYFLLKNCEIIVNNRLRSVLANSRKLTRYRRNMRPYTDVQLNTIIEDYIKQNKELFHYRNDNRFPFRKKLEHTLKSYVFFQIGGRKTKEIARLQKTSPQSIYRQVESFKIFLATSPPLQIETQAAKI